MSQTDDSGITDELAASLTNDEPPEEDAGFVDQPNGELEFAVEEGEAQLLRLEDDL